MKKSSNKKTSGAILNPKVMAIRWRKQRQRPRMPMTTYWQLSLKFESAVAIIVLVLRIQSATKLLQNSDVTTNLASKTIPLENLNTQGLLESEVDPEDKPFVTAKVQVVFLFHQMLSRLSYQGILSH
jgi:hypothetical protein